MIEPTKVPGRGLRPTTEVARGLLDGLVALVPAEQQGIARGLAKEVQALFTALNQKNRSREDPETVIVANL